MKKLLCVLLIAVMLLTLCACNDDERIGHYTCMSVDNGDGTGMPNGEWIELSSADSGKIKTDLELSFDWSMDGDNFTMTTKVIVDTYTGTLRDGILVLNCNGVEMTFVKEGVSYTPPERPSVTTPDPWATAGTTGPTESAAESTEPVTDAADPDAAETSETKPTATESTATEPAATEPSAAPSTETNPTETTEILTSLQNWWNGNYYGYYALFENDQDETNYWWDCCADINLDVAGEGLLRIWDETYNDPEDGLASVWIAASESTGSHGVAQSVNGWFLSTALTQDDWSLDSGNEDFPNGVVIVGWYEEDGIEYRLKIYLRKWGLSWDDVADNYIGLPEYYDTWYKPAIEQGLAMPSTLLGECGDGLEAQGAASRAITSNFIPKVSSTDVKLPFATLSAAYKAMDDDWLDMYLMDYTDVITTYMNGVEGRIGYVNRDGTGFMMYWLAGDRDDNTELEIDFELNEEGVWMFAGKGRSNSLIDG